MMPGLGLGLGLGLQPRRSGTPPENGGNGNGNGGEEPSAETHRYWRIQPVTGSNGEFWSVNEIELRSSVDGADKTGSGTPISGTERAGFEDDKAFDGSDSTAWSADIEQGIANCWIGYDFGDGNDLEIVEVALKARDDEFFPQMVEDFLVEYSDDGTNWTPYWGAINAGTYSQNEQKVFAKPDVGETARYWGVIARGESDNGRFLSICEIEMRSSTGGADQTGSGTESASEVRATFPASEAFDDITTGHNAWGVQWGDVTGEITYHMAWIMYDFGDGNDLDIAEMTIQARDDGFEAHTPRSVDFFKSGDGAAILVDWSDHAIDAWTSGEVETFTRPS